MPWNLWIILGSAVRHINNNKNKNKLAKIIDVKCIPQFYWLFPLFYFFFLWKYCILNTLFIYFLFTYELLLEINKRIKFSYKINCSLRLQFYSIYFYEGYYVYNIFTIFYNKSHVISCYWFKFQTNAKITFLP